MCKCAFREFFERSLQKKFVFNLVVMSIGSILSGAGSVVGGLAGAIGQIGAQRRQYKYQKKLLNDQYDIWLKQTAEQQRLNEYNYNKYESPSATLAQYEKAGLGPAAMLDSVSFAPSMPAAAGAPGASSGGVQQESFSGLASSISQTFQGLADLDVKGALADKYRSDAERNDWENVFTREQIANQSRIRQKLEAEVGVLRSQKILTDFRSGLLAIDLANSPAEYARKFEKLDAEIDNIKADRELKQTMKIDALASVMEKMSRSQLNYQQCAHLAALTKLTNEQWRDLKHTVDARLANGSYDERAQADSILNWLNSARAALFGAEENYTNAKAKNANALTISEIVRNYGATFYFGAGGAAKIVDMILKATPQGAVISGGVEAAGQMFGDPTTTGFPISY